MARVTQAEYARRIGIDKAAVLRRTRERGGPIPTHGARKLIDVAEADALWEATMSTQGRGGRAAAQGSRHRSQASSDGAALAHARATIAIADAELRRLRVAERRGELVSRHTTLAKFYAALRSVRDALQAWPARAGAEIAAELHVEPARLMIVLEPHVRRLLDELADVQLDTGAGVGEKAGSDGSSSNGSGARRRRPRARGRSRARASA
jgi:hypothetical protein